MVQAAVKGAPDRPNRGRQPDPGPLGGDAVQGFLHPEAAVERVVVGEAELGDRPQPDLIADDLPQVPSAALEPLEACAPLLLTAEHGVEDLRDRGVGFRSLQEGAIDTTTASGELIFNIFSALAQFERRFLDVESVSTW